MKTYQSLKAALAANQETLTPVFLEGQIARSKDIDGFCIIQNPNTYENPGAIIPH